MPGNTNRKVFDWTKSPIFKYKYIVPHGRAKVKRAKGKKARKHKVFTTFIAGLYEVLTFPRKYISYITLWTIYRIDQREN